jgi:acetylornithine deacetylase/succinyl-diaminopimelate desuccinylase-like protein
MPKNVVSRSEVLEIFKELIRAPSVNPSIAPDEGHGEEAIAKVARQWLETKDVRSRLEEAAPGRPNVVAEVGTGEERTVVFLRPFGHSRHIGNDDSAV